MINKSGFPSIFKVQTLFSPISIPDKHAELFKIRFKSLSKKLKLRLKVH